MQDETCFFYIINIVFLSDRTWNVLKIGEWTLDVHIIQTPVIHQSVLCVFIKFE